MPDRKPEILIVDDDPFVHAALRRTLLEQPWVLHHTTSAGEAWTLLEQRKVDVILCDYCMPGQNGLALLERVHERFPDVLRLLLTGSVETRILEDALREAVVDGYQEKPWNDEDLIGNIQRALGERGQERAVLRR